jgi:hypothetical protein
MIVVETRSIPMTRSSFCAAASLLSICALSASGAKADIHQPDGTLIPNDDGTSGCHSGGNMGGCLDEGEIAIGGTAGRIDSIHDATINQETFDAGCQLTFKVVSYGTSILDHLFGWYEAKPGNTPPALKDLHVFLDCTEAKAIGRAKTLTLPPGTGPIAFFTASGFGNICDQVNAAGTLTEEPEYTMYTERRYNGRLRDGSPDPNSVPDFVRVLTYQSVAQPASFYFAWEDDGSTNSDQNFEDLVTWVSGIQCSSGGDPCDTGLKGFCAMGTKQCRGGVLTCVGDRMPGPEKCNAIDDDCDGDVDEGNPCDPGYVCFRGNCVPNCARGEFSCGAGAACEADASVCIDVGCFGVTCPAGQLCRAGACVGECVGVRCPFGQACRLGACVDVCATQTCDTGFVCVPSYPASADRDPVGLCANCGCQGCPAGTTCAAMHCVPNDCAAVTCSPGSHCVGGSCVDDCAGAVCPPSQKCEQGRCVPDPNAVKDAGADVSPPTIITTSTTGGTTSGSGSTTGAGGAGAGDARPRGAGPGGASCGCRVPRSKTPDGSAIALALLACGAFARRRPRTFGGSAYFARRCGKR